MVDSHHRTGSGEPVVLLHGITSSWHGWKPVIPALAERYDVIALTLPGHLGWPWPGDREPTVATMADLVDEKLGGLGIDTPHFAGNSLGGWISLELAARRRALSVTAFSPAGGWTDPVDMSAVFLPVQARVAELRASAAEILADPDRRRRLLSVFMERGDLMPLDEAIRGWDAVLAVQNLQAMVASARSPVRSSVPGDVPVSLVWGAREQLLPEDFGAPGWRDAAPRAVWSRIDAGHTPMYDAPEAVVRAIEETIARA